jgi:Skp family chaperone for outer membrane proteins
MKRQSDLDAEAKRRAARGARRSLQTQQVGASYVPNVSEPGAEQPGVTAVSYNNAPEPVAQQPGMIAVSYDNDVAEPEVQQPGVTAVSYNYEQESVAQQPGVTAVSFDSVVAKPERQPTDVAAASHSYETEPKAQQPVTSVSYNYERELATQQPGVTFVSYNYEPKPPAQQPGVTAVSYGDESAPAVSPSAAASQTAVRTVLSQAEQDAEAKRRARGGSARMMQTVSPEAVSEPMGPPVDAAAASYSQTTWISQVEQDAEAKRRARGGGRMMAAALQMGAVSVVESPTAPAVNATATRQASDGIGAMGMGAPAAVEGWAPAVVADSARAAKPGVQMVSGEEAEALENRMRRKEERGTRSDARAERRANATRDVTDNTTPAPIVAPVLRPGAVTVIASAAMQHAPKVDSVSVSSTFVGAVNSAELAASGADKEQKSLEKELTPEERVAAERQRKLNEKMAAMDREDQLRESRNSRQELRQEKQSIMEQPIPPSDAENDTSNATGHFAPHLLNHGNQQSMLKVGTQPDQHPFAEKGVPEKSEGLGAEQEQPVYHPVVTADYGAITAPDVIGGYFTRTRETDDDQLAVAIAIEEDEEEKFIAAAVEYDPNAKPPIYKNRRFLMYGYCGMCCVWLAVAFVIVLLVGTGGPSEITIKRQSITAPPTDPPTGAPTSSSESIFRKQFSTLVGDQVFVDGTPHDLAAQWIMFEDPMKLTTDAENLEQRYLLSFFYFHTTLNGADRWRSCNPPGIAGFDGQADLDDIDPTDPDKCLLYEFVRLEDDSIGYQPVPDKIRWMSSKPECEWQGVQCQGSTNVLGVEFCTYHLLCG